MRSMASSRSWFFLRTILSETVSGFAGFRWARRDENHPLRNASAIFTHHL
jgi:hypothetical protein